MIICSKQEGNGTYREFVIDDTATGDEVPVKTHLAHRTGEATVSEADWRDAGRITRARDGLEASVLKQSRRGTDFVKLDRIFSNEIAALQAIALHFEPAEAPQVH